MTKKVTIAILNWNGVSLLEQFLPQLYQYTDPELADLMVIDNGSTDQSLEFLQTHYPLIKIKVLDQNYGFAGGYNHGLVEIKTPYVVLLNSDVEVSQGWLEPLVNHLEQNNDCAACQPKVRSFRNKELFEHAGACGGFIDKFGFPYCRGRIFSHVEKDEGQYNETSDIFWATGACFAIKSDDFFSTGGFDESFFAHMEEIDLCWRLQLKGRCISYVPNSTVYHLGGATLTVESPRKTYLNFRNNLLMLYKNLPPKQGASILRARILFDFAAFFLFAIQGYFKNALSIIYAHRDFRKMDKTLYKRPAVNLLKQRPEALHSIVFGYYLRRIRTFSNWMKYCKIS